MVTQSNKSVLRWMALGLFIFFFSLQTKGQDIGKQQTKSKDKFRDYLNIYFSNNNYFPASIKSYGLSKFESNFSRSYGVGMGYTRRLNKDWGLSVGMEYTAPRVSFTIINANDNISLNEPLTQYERFKFSTGRDFSMNLNLSMLKDIYIKDFLYHRIQAGISLDFISLSIYSSRGYYQGESPSDFKLFYNLFLNPTKNQKRITGSYFVKIGMGFDLKEKRHLNINIVAKHSPSIVAFGLYSFHNTQDVSRGSINRRISYLGLELNYSFALRKGELFFDKR